MLWRPLEVRTSEPAVQMECEHLCFRLVGATITEAQHGVGSIPNFKCESLAVGHWQQRERQCRLL